MKGEDNFGDTQAWMNEFGNTKIFLSYCFSVGTAKTEILIMDRKKDLTKIVMNR